MISLLNSDILCINFQNRSCFKIAYLFLHFYNVKPMMSVSISTSNIKPCHSSCSGVSDTRATVVAGLDPEFCPQDVTSLGELSVILACQNAVNEWCHMFTWQSTFIYFSYWPAPPSSYVLHWGVWRSTAAISHKENLTYFPLVNYGSLLVTWYKKYFSTRNIFFSARNIFFRKKYFFSARNIFFPQEIYFSARNKFFSAKNIFFSARNIFFRKNFFSARNIFFRKK